MSPRPERSYSSLDRAASGAWPFVGRNDQLQLVSEAIGRPRTAGVVVAGGPGLGKTRLAAEALAQAKARGFEIAWVVAAQAAASIPFGPLAHLLPDTSTEASSRLELLRQTGQTLARRAGGKRMVLGVDDAHLLDDASAALVHHLATTSTAFVLATVRTREPVSDAVTALWKDTNTEWLELSPLDEAACAELVESALGGQVEGATLHELWRLSKGNALFMCELMNGALDAGTLARVEGVWRATGPMATSTRLVEVVEARLGQLDDERRLALEALTVAGALPVEVLSSVVSPETLRSLLSQGLVMTRSRDAGGRGAEELTAYLGHPVYGVLLRGQLGPVRMQALRRQLLDAIEARPHRSPTDTVRLATLRLDHGTSVDTDQLMLASRYVQAAFPQAVSDQLKTGSPPVDAVTAAVAAGDPPNRPSEDDLAVAERLARAAWDADHSPAAGRALTAILVADGRAAEAEEVIIELDSVATSSEDHAAVALERATLLLWVLGRPEAAMQVLRTAEADLADPDLIARLQRLRGGVALNIGRVDEAVEISTPLIKAAGPDEPLAAMAAATAAAALAIRGEPAEAVALIDRYLPVAMAHIADIPDALGQLLFGRVFAVRMLGRLDEAEWFAYACYQAAAEHGSLGAMAVFTGVLGQVALDRGQPATAAHRLREAEVLLRERDTFGYRPLALAYLAVALAQTGDAEAATEACQQMEAASSWPRFFDCELCLASAWSHVAAARTREAVVAATRAADTASAMGVQSFEAGALHTVVRLGAPETVSQRLAELASIIGSPLVDAFAAHAAAAAAGDGPALDAVADQFDQLGTRLLAAEAAAAAGAAHERRGDATAAFRSDTRSRTLAAACEDAQTPGLRQGMRSPWLTTREHEVAALAADGLTSKAIAERLVVSPRTVESHLYRVFAKLGVSDRSQLADVLGVHR
jgi:DNA-binding CsgD family transcriptional regulator/tetratricopeptide (TPR) repeat protein